MPKRADTRTHWTLKGHEFDPEFMAAVRMAAAAQGQTLTAFVADTLRQRATEVLKGEDAPPAHPTPIRLEDVTTELAELVRGMAETLTREQATRLEAIRRETKRGRWRR
jgi:Protein of unknown function (DUF1778)